jgi:hypothetical protein
MKKQFSILQWLVQITNQMEQIKKYQPKIINGQGFDIIKFRKGFCLECV